MRPDTTMLGVKQKPGIKQNENISPRVLFTGNISHVRKKDQQVAISMVLKYGLPIWLHSFDKGMQLYTVEATFIIRMGFSKIGCPLYNPP